LKATRDRARRQAVAGIVSVRSSGGLPIPKKMKGGLKGGIAFFLFLVEVSDRHATAVAGREQSGAKNSCNASGF